MCETVPISTQSIDTIQQAAALYCKLWINKNKSYIRRLHKYEYGGSSLCLPHLAAHSLANSIGSDSFHCPWSNWGSRALLRGPVLLLDCQCWNSKLLLSDQKQSPNMLSHTPPPIKSEMGSWPMHACTIVIISNHSNRFVCVSMPFKFPLGDKKFF